jgi:hypothetical protein
VGRKNKYGRRPGGKGATLKRKEQRRLLQLEQTDNNYDRANDDNDDESPLIHITNTNNPDVPRFSTIRKFSRSVSSDGEGNLVIKARRKKSKVSRQPTHIYEEVFSDDDSVEIVELESNKSEVVDLDLVNYDLSKDQQGNLDNLAKDCWKFYYARKRCAKEPKQDNPYFKKNGVNEVLAALERKANRSKIEAEHKQQQKVRLSSAPSDLQHVLSKRERDPKRAADHQQMIEKIIKDKRGKTG